MTTLCARLLAAAFAVFALVQTSHAASINLGGIRLPLPSITVDPGYSNDYRGRNIYRQPRWHVVVQDGHTFATNDQGVWVGHDEAGDMVMQIEVANIDAKKGGTVPAQIDINGRFFATVPATVASEHLVVVQGADVERILGGLMRGNMLRVVAGANILELRLSGSSAAISQVRSAAALQRRLVAEGKIKITPKQPAEEADANAIRYFLPGVQGTGIAEVRFNIVEGTGLVLYAKFAAIPGHGDPEYSIPMTRTEARRAIALIRKAKEWTEIAVKNRVGLFSKRIGYFDDTNGVDEELLEGEQEGSEQSMPAEDKAGGDLASKQDNSAAASDQSQQPKMPAKKEEPKDFKAINFNSYEDGSTSVQIEHAVKGFSRRFNLSLQNALKLADSLASTLEYATFKLEKRDYDTDQRDKLFQ